MADSSKALRSDRILNALEDFERKEALFYGHPGMDRVPDECYTDSYILRGELCPRCFVCTCEPPLSTTLEAPASDPACPQHGRALDA